MTGTLAVPTIEADTIEAKTNFLTLSTLNTGVDIRLKSDRDIAFQNAVGTKNLIWSVSFSSLFPGVSGGLSLGTSTKLWNNLFLSGNLDDATNSISIADILNKTGDTMTGDLAIGGSLQAAKVQELEPTNPLVGALWFDTS